MNHIFRNIARYLTVLAVIVTLNLGITSGSQAQFTDIGSFIQAGEADAALLTREYLRPFGEGIGSVTNTGWVNRANPHRKLGFDIQIRASGAMVPTNRREFDISTLDLQAVKLSNPADRFTPTISGKNNTGAEVDIFGKRQDALKNT
ncbi:MAG: DUF6588 family protein [Balneolales bacterium]